MVLLTCLHHQTSGMLLVSAITVALVAKWLSHFMAQLKVYRFYSRYSNDSSYKNIFFSELCMYSEIESWP